MPRTKLKIDAAFNEEEQRRDPIEVEIPGLPPFELPGVMNALATIRVARWAEQGKTELTAQEAIALLGDLVPDDVLRKLHGAGFDILDPGNASIVEKLVLAAIAEYQERAIASGSVAPGKAHMTAPQPPPYSPTGHSSEPTSPVSTAPSFPVT